MTPLAISVFFGSLQNVLTRAAKYTVFDSTKEMAFIPLSEENKLKGKSAIDGIASRLGKSGSSFIMQILLMIFSTTVACSPIIAVILLLLIPFWITAISSVNKKFQEASKEKTLIEN
jgi:AAA family ATP:ADP antiporter